MRAVCNADVENRRDLYEIALYVYNEMPSACWGNHEKVRAWLHGGWELMTELLASDSEPAERSDAHSIPKFGSSGCAGGDCGKDGGRRNE